MSLVAVDLSGVVAWVRKLPNLPGGSYQGNAVAAGSGFVVASTIGGVVCLDASSGDVVWQRGLADFLVCEIHIWSGRVLCMDSEGVRMLDLTSGALLWHHSLPRGASLVAASVTGEAEAVAFSYREDNPAFSCLHLEALAEDSGETNSAHAVGWTNTGGGWPSDLVAIDSRLFMATDRAVYAFSMDSHNWCWQRYVRKDEHLYGPGLMSLGGMVVVQVSGKVVCLDPGNGRSAWSTAGWIVSVSPDQRRMAVSTKRGTDFYQVLGKAELPSDTEGDLDDAGSIRWCPNPPIRGRP
jgi:outer membrane protein assembly factor BamB